MLGIRHLENSGKKKEKTWVFLMRFALGNVSGDTWKSECRLKT